MSIPAEHRSTTPSAVRCAVITVSDTRTREPDTAGGLIGALLQQAGHVVQARHIIPDEPGQMKPMLEKFRDDANIDAVLLTGGTGLSSRGQTSETVSSLITKPLPGYGEIFRMLSYQEIGAAAMLSR